LGSSFGVINIKMDIQELKDLIDQNIIDNSKRVSTTKTTASMLKQVLGEIVNTMEASAAQGSDERYHTKIYGEVKLFHGNYYSLPSGWVICDGYNGTPDLRGKIPVGWSNGWQEAAGEADLSDYQHIGRMGGKKLNNLIENQLPSHTHISTSSATVTDTHKHKFSDDTNNADAELRVNNGISPVTTNPASQDISGSGEGSGRIYETSSASSGSISVNVNTTNQTTGIGESIENRQPYIVMMFIMYTGSTIASTQTKVAWSEYDGTTGVKVTEGDSNHKYGFRYVAPASFGSSDPSNYDPLNQTGDIISNIGFIPENDLARPLENWLQVVSLGDNLGDDN
jgi:microcystin-dependent protein